MEYSPKIKKEESANCYFFCKKNDNNIKFIGFNKEIFEFNDDDFDGSKFENNEMYFFEKLSKKENTYSFVKNKSFFSKNQGEIITDYTNYDSSFPYSLTGKIVLKEVDKIFLLLSATDDIIILTDIEDKFNDIEENQYVKISYVRFSFRKCSVVYLKWNYFSSLELLDKRYQETKINNKVAIKLNLLDYKENLKVEDILLTQFEIESPLNYLVKYSSYSKAVYYVYDAKNYKNEYFAQNINLYFRDELYPINLKFFVYKGSLNEANIYVTQKCLYAYEFLYFSIDNSLPKEIKIYTNNNVIYKTNNFHSFNSKTRKNIIFLNIPAQSKEDDLNDNSFLSIYLCQKDKTELYGTFCLKSIEYRNKSPYKFDPIIEKNLQNIYEDYSECIKKNESDKFIKKYFSFGKYTNKILESVINDNFYLYDYEDDVKTLKYFNSICLWNLCNIIFRTSQDTMFIDEYISLYNKIIKNTNLNNIDKIKILVSFITISLEDKNNVDCPKFFFYDELAENNPYKIAYNFQYKIIEEITEESCLFQPFLFLDSYIMDNIYSKSFKFVKDIKSCYSISMLSLDLIKEHLKKSIKNYFFVLEKRNKKNMRNYKASIHKFSKIVVYNENILLSNSNYNKMYELSQSNFIFQSKDIKNYAFTLNLENIHENFSHGKETIINIKDSPTLYFDRNMKFSFICNLIKKNQGEAGRLVESFIGNSLDIETMKKTIYDMSDFLDIKYFIDKDFNKLIEGFKNKKSLYNKNNNNYNFNIINAKSSINYDIKTKSNEEKNDLADKNNKSKNEISLSNQKNMNIENDENDKENELFISQYNTITITADTFEELIEKVEEIQKKNLKLREDGISYINKMCWY